MTVVLTGERLTLRPLRTRDLGPTYLSWLNDPEVTRWLSTRPPVTAKDLRGYFSRFKGSSTDRIFAIIENSSRKHIGNVTLNHIDALHRIADTGLMIGRRECWGKGYAYDAWHLAISHAFGPLGLRKVFAGVVDGNSASEATLRKLGFREEGRLRRHWFINGAYRDVLRFGLFEDEFAATRRLK